MFLNVAMFPKKISLDGQGFSLAKTISSMLQAELSVTDLLVNMPAQASKSESAQTSSSSSKSSSVINTI